ncbi:MAG: hypothetical protein PHQ28_06770 [Mycobacterium sp.]|nr:hypothetical protein [Mycobacterium sp.]
MNDLMMYPPWIEQTVRRASAVCPAAGWAQFSHAASAALRPLAVTVGVITAGAMSFAPAHADPITSVLNGTGTGDNGSFNSTLASVGQSLCPMLVKPGATLATIASQLSGKGLPPDMVGAVASMAIQMECPGVMTSLANGQMPSALQGLGAGSGMPLPFQMPCAGAAPASPLQLPGLGASASLPVPGAVPTAASPLQVPGI